MVKRRRGANSPVPGRVADVGAAGRGQSTGTADGGADGSVAGGSRGGSSSGAAPEGAAPDNANSDGGGNSGQTAVGNPKGQDSSPSVVKDSTAEWLEKVRKQLDFYFSDANLRRDKFLQERLKEGGDFVPLKTILQFNRIKALKCRNPTDLARAIEKSDILVLSPDKKKVGRDLAKAPIEDFDPLPRTVYVEGFPLRLSLDDLHTFFARHGVVRLVDRPRHPQTREPLGHCFVEYASAAQAGAAAAALDGYWHPTWLQALDSKVLRSMLKQRWLDFKCEFKALKRASRGATSSATPEPTTASTTGAASSTATAIVTGAASEAAVSPAIGATSAASTPAAPSSKRRGCLVRISGFPDPQTRLSIRQFVEHAVPVEYCDFETGCSWAHLTLRSAEDCRTLLEDLRLTRRLLGALRPQVTVLGPEEEDEYWQEVKLRRASRDSAATAPSSRKSAKRRQSSASQRPQEMRWNPQGTIDGGPTKHTLLRLWVGDEGQRRRGEERPGNSSDAAPASADQAGSSSSTAAASASAPSRVSYSFVDTVAGNAGMVQAGLGWRQREEGRKFKPKARLRAAVSRTPPPMPPMPPPGMPAASAPTPNPSLPLMPPPPPVRPPGGGPPAKVPRLASAGSAGSSSSAAVLVEHVPAASDSDGEPDVNFLLSVPLPPPSPACPGAFPKRGTLKGAKAKRTGAPPRTVPPIAPWTPGAGASSRGPRSAIGGAGPMSLLPPPSPFAVHSERQKGKSTEVQMPPPSPVAVHSTGAPAAGATSSASASDGASAAAGGSATGADPSAGEVGPGKPKEEDKSTPVIDSMLEDAEDILSLDF